MTTGKEKLLIPRTPLYYDDYANHVVGDTYVEHFSTTSPPAYVTNEYRITRKDHDGLWGILVDSSVEEMDISEV